MILNLYPTRVSGDLIKNELTAYCSYRNSSSCFRYRHCTCGVRMFFYMIRLFSYRGPFGMDSVIKYTHFHFPCVEMNITMCDVQTYNSGVWRPYPGFFSSWCACSSLVKIHGIPHDLWKLRLDLCTDTLLKEPCIHTCTHIYIRHTSNMQGNSIYIWYVKAEVWIVKRKFTRFYLAASVCTPASS